MPKLQYIIDKFERGIDSHSDPRDVPQGYVADCVNMMVDEVGRARTMGSDTDHVSQSGDGIPAVLSRNDATAAGYGLFHFSHDRLGAHGFGGTHTSTTHATIMTDSNTNFAVDALIGATINNTTDGSSGVITDNGATTITVASLTGGTDNDWDNGDAYTITDLPETSDDYLMAISVNNAQLHCYSFDNDAWGASELHDFGTGYYAQPTFYQFDGGIRVCSGNFNFTAGAQWTPIWYGYIERDKFLTAEDTPTYTDDNWYVLDAYLSPPPAGSFTHATLPAVSQHTGGTHATILTDSGASFTPSALVGGIIKNLTDGSSGTITANNATTVTADDLLGGSDNQWELDDRYKIVYVPSFTSASLSGAAGKVNVAIHTQEDSELPESEWQKEWECGITYVYDGTQETLVTMLENTVDLSELTDISTAQFELQIFAEDGDRCNQRLTHVKVYIRESGKQEWFVQGVWDLKNGGRLINGDTYDYWDVVSSTDDYNRAFNYENTQIIPQILHTWETETGLFNDEKSIDVGQLGDGYKCACVMGRTVYIGNVRRTNHAGETLVEADAMYKSIPDQPDTFPASWRIDAMVNDGEGITALHKWGKDLLQFKHRTLYILDTSGETEILKATHKLAGVRGSWAVTETPFGICWANNWGIWMYNGELQNLMSQDTLGSHFVSETPQFNVSDPMPLPNRPRPHVTNPIPIPNRPFPSVVGSSTPSTVETSTWDSFYNVGTMVGYYPYKQQLIIFGDCQANDNRDVYIYDFRTKSLVRGTNIIVAGFRSNFVIDRNNDLLWDYGHAPFLKKWNDPETAVAGQEIVFPEVGQLGKKMKVYEVSVTYKSSVTQATPLYYRLNGASTWTAFGTEGFADTGDGITEGWSRQVFNISPFLECETIQLKLDFPSSGVIQINDITMVYRPLIAKRVS